MTSSKQPYKPPVALSSIQEDRRIYDQALSIVLATETQNAKNRATVFFVEFRLSCSAGFGESVKVVGDHWKLGMWNAKNAMALKWTPGNVWVGEFFMDDVPSKKFEFKYILVGRHHKVRWEEGPNRQIQLTYGGELRRGKMYHTLNDSWVLPATK